MTVANSTIDVTDEPQSLSVFDNNTVGYALALTNTGSTVVYLGGSDVDSVDGFPLEPTAIFTVDVISSSDEWFAICADSETGTLKRVVAGVA